MSVRLSPSFTCSRIDCLFSKQHQVLRAGIIPSSLTFTCPVPGAWQVASERLQLGSVWAPHTRLRCLAVTCWGQCSILDTGVRAQWQGHVLHFSLTALDNQSRVPSLWWAICTYALLQPALRGRYFYIPIVLKRNRYRKVQALAQGHIGKWPN